MLTQRTPYLYFSKLNLLIYENRDNDAIDVSCTHVYTCMNKHAYVCVKVNI